MIFTELFVSLLVTSAFVIISLFVSAFFIARKIKKWSVVDVIWAGSFFIVAIACLWLINQSAEIKWHAVVALFILATWSLRLFMYLSQRFRGKPDDPRYVKLAEKWQGPAHFEMFLFFQFQALSVFLLCLPVFFIVGQVENVPQFFISAALGLGLLAIIGESTADNQLAKHKKNSTGLCRTGLWKYSRHPNYFFEWLHWFAYLILLLPTAYWYVGLVSPVIMYIFLLKITGVPYAEKMSLAKRGQEYKEYMESTNMFFLWFPKTKLAEVHSISKD